MNKFLAALLLGTLTYPALARDDHHMLPIKDVIDAPAVHTKVDRSIKLFFGDQPYPKGAMVIGEWKTNKKTNAFNKTDKEACEWVFLSAILELQERAAKEGGDAVVNIKSNYKNNERSSETEYMCGAGALMAGVALKGTVVKMPK